MPLRMHHLWHGLSLRDYGPHGYCFLWGSLLGTSGSSCFTTPGTLLVVLTVPQGSKVDVVGAMLVGGGLLEVLPTALEKVAGGPLMEEVDLGPGVALRGGQ